MPEPVHQNLLNFTVLSQMTDVRRQIIEYLDGLPEEEFVRVTDPEWGSVAHAVIFWIQSDMACMNIIRGHETIEILDERTLRTKLDCMNALKAVEVLKMDFCKEMAGADVERELNVIHKDRPNRKARIKDVLEQMVIPEVSPMMQVGFALKRLGRHHDLMFTMGIQPGEGEETFN